MGNNKKTIQEHEHNHHKATRLDIILNMIGIFVFVIAISFQYIFHFPDMILVGTYLLSYFLVGYEILFNAVKKLFRKDMFDENFLMSIATLGAFLIGEYTEGVAVLLFYKVGEFLQDLAVANSKKKISSALDIRAEYANLLVGSTTKIVKPEELKIGDIIVIKNGEKVPVDGVVISGKTNIDTSVLTGESLPREVKVGEQVLSGVINLDNVIQIKVTQVYEKSTAYKIVELIENASSKKSRTEKFISKFAKIYTPIVTLLAVTIFLLLPSLLHITFEESLTRALSFLVVSCPCALVVSIPLGFFVGIGTCGKKGILVKGSNYLDLLSNIDKMVFDKTGTLTKGTFDISNVEIVNDNFDEEEMMEYLAICESYSNHYLAKSIIASYEKEIDLSRVNSHEEISGMGIKVVVDEKTIFAGNEKLLEKNKIKFSKVNTIDTVIYIAIDYQYVGYVLMSDTLKVGTSTLIDELKQLGIKETILLTGDTKKFATKIANDLKIDQVYAELLPQDKVRVFEKLKGQNHEKETIVYVGDGINDGPVIAQADVGIAMGKGADIAIETADIVLMDDDINKIIDNIKIAKRTKQIVIQNIAIVLIVKVVFLIMSGLGISTMWEAVFADVGIALIAILNSLRIAKIKL